MTMKHAGPLDRTTSLQRTASLTNVPNCAYHVLLLPAPARCWLATNDGQLPPDPRNLCQTPFACLSCFRLDILARVACSTKRGALTWSRILPSHRGHHGTSTVSGLPKGVSRRYEGVDGGQKNPCPRSYLATRAQPKQEDRQKKNKCASGTFTNLPVR